MYRPYRVAFILLQSLYDFSQVERLKGNSSRSTRCKKANPLNFHLVVLICFSFLFCFTLYIRRTGWPNLLHHPSVHSKILRGIENKLHETLILKTQNLFYLKLYYLLNRSFELRIYIFCTNKYHIANELLTTVCLVTTL